MKTIWKYELTLENLRNGIDIPYPGKVLSIQEQNGVHCMWVQVDTEESRMIALEAYGTGHKLPEYFNKTYLATLQYLNGQLVFHLFL